jgi:3-deoxy-D-manno-octulosonic-acid transferase
VRSPLRFAYDAAATIARAATELLPAGESKLLRSFTDRRGLIDRYRAWGAAHRDPSRPLLWMHAPSVGEGLQARPILERARERRADLQLAYTYFSPSAVKLAERMPADFRDYLVFDAASDAAAAIDALAPTALVFSKLDVWPNLVAAARARSTKLGMVSATLSRHSSRQSLVARSLLREAYASLDAVGAIDGGDADRLVQLGVRQETIEVTGDTRYDQVWDRAARLDRTQPVFATLVSDRPTLVAGSTWPADEQVLLAAVAQLRRATPDLRLIIAPHEPTAEHLAPLDAWAKRCGAAYARLGDSMASVADVVIVDRVGVLGDLYGLASIAYVGGGFHSAGLHSVLEPAAFGAPVIFGPRFEMSRDADLLLQHGGGASVTDKRSMVSTLTRWLRDDGLRREAGDAAHVLVRSGIGAAERTFALVERLLG